MYWLITFAVVAAIIYWKRDAVFNYAKNLFFPGQPPTAS